MPEQINEYLAEYGIKGVSFSAKSLFPLDKIIDIMFSKEDRIEVPDTFNQLIQDAGYEALRTVDLTEEEDLDL